MSPGGPRQRRLPGGRCGEKDTSEDPETGLEGGGSLRRPGRPRRIQEGGKKFQCPECKKSFTTNGHLKSHLSIHTAEKKYECPECEKSFKTSSLLQRHLKIHSGQKPHKCLECGKRFNLQRHLRIRSGQKPNKCLEYGKSISMSGNLHRHQKVHLNKCLESGESFEKPRDPQMIQEGGKKYQCPE
ncbi:zinc finger protein 501-like, partial [Notechis scutatus]|uniref:Zinc finger protein 501-like n=1 Tax=Notechis scutatus TaxID=8663 RepID=A0A6J1WDE2_9SAUR